ncbi:MAG: hypothetical protein MI748_09740 [Opitutales bacterium]|nr:hypothetical protein [Opitutales bacterium]
MPDQDPNLSRRAFFKRFIPGSDISKETEPPAPEDNLPKIAVIKGRLCLAYDEQSCRNCLDVCPEEGAIFLEDDQYPMVEPSICTGCADCLPVCPAEECAIELYPKAV